ncbi:Probable hexosyltransferase MUCI70 [Linum perenne]
MTVHKMNVELPPDRRNTFGTGLNSPGRFRRGKRSGRFFRRPIYWVLVLLLSALSLVFTGLFGLRFLFPAAGNSDMQAARKVTMEMEISVVHEETGGNSSFSSSVGRTNFSFPGAGYVAKPKHRRQRKFDFPCRVEFAKSVDYVKEPDSVTNFTQFSLGYVNREEMNSTGPVFGGHQSMMQREDSFHAKNQTIHCGFVEGPPGSPTTPGFDLDEKDKAFMSRCRVTVSSCIFGSSDFLRRPANKNMSEFSRANVCFVMFVDDQTLEKLSSEGAKPDDRGYVGLWKLVVVKNLPYSDMRRTGKVPKFLSHRLFPSSRYSIWVDSKLRLAVDPMLIIERFLWRTRSEFAISKHYDRQCVWEEVLQNKRLNKYRHSEIDRQFYFYRSDGLTKFDPSDPNTPLPSCIMLLCFSDVPEGSFIVRAHTPMSNLFSCLWFNEVDRFTSRDQLSFAYTYLKLRRSNPDKPFHLKMFEVS